MSYSFASFNLHEIQRLCQGDYFSEIVDIETPLKEGKACKKKSPKGFKGLQECTNQGRFASLVMTYSINRHCEKSESICVVRHKEFTFQTRS